MNVLDRFKKKPKVEGAVIVTLAGSSLDQSVYDQHDLSTLEDQIVESLHGTGLGAFDGNEVGPAGCHALHAGDDLEQAGRTKQGCKDDGSKSG